MEVNKIYNKLLNEFGEQGWWPIKGKYSPENSYPKNNKQRFEICTGAILTQNTSWKNVEKAIENLRRNKLFTKQAIKKINAKKLAKIIKSSGYHNQKAKKLKEFAEFNKEVNRENLLQIWGIGKETADSILCYAYSQPVFVVDAYTLRIFSRLGFQGNYDSTQELIMNNLDPKYYNEFHALLVKLGKDYCKKKPLCRECCLRDICKFF